MNPGPITKGPVPPRPPKAAQRLRYPGRLHDWFDAKSKAFPGDGKQCEYPEVKQTKHRDDSGPARRNGIANLRKNSENEN